MDLDHALESHVAWKVRLRMAIFQKEYLDATCLGAEDCCELGKWLKAEGWDNFGAFPAYAECAARHVAFHAEAGRIARAINAGHYEEASELLKPAKAFTATSAALGHALAMFRDAVLESQAAPLSPPSATAPPPSRSR